MSKWHSVRNVNIHQTKWKIHWIPWLVNIVYCDATKFALSCIVPIIKWSEHRMEWRIIILLEFIFSPRDIHKLNDVNRSFWHVNPMWNLNGKSYVFVCALNSQWQQHLRSFFFFLYLVFTYLRAWTHFQCVNKS